MRGPIIHEAHLYSVYFAPRGKVRLINLGIQLSQRHLHPMDRLIGIIGDAGAGKSILIRGMFPGLELSNDDNGVNVRPLPLLSVEENDFFTCHTYHLDVRFESAFVQIPALATAVLGAIETGKRVIVEHFDLLYPYININAELLIGMGEEVIVTRPTIFGPEPAEIAKIVNDSMPYRRMIHTSEDLVQHALLDQGCRDPYTHGDVRHGFMLEFNTIPDVNIEKIEKGIQKLISEDVPISFLDESHILIGGEKHYCTSPRLHVSSAGKIENFSLMKNFKYDPMSQKYLLVGLVGRRSGDETDLNSLRF